MAGFWRKCRLTFRWLRFAVWGVALLALLAGAWFNLIGLPDFLKTRLVATLRQRGVELEFSRMRLRYVHGLVAENVRLGGAQNAGLPVLTVGEVQLRLNYPALLHGRLQLDGLVLRNGKFTLPLSPTNTLALRNLQTELRFQTNDAWSLDHFRAEFAGVRISLAGTVAHPLAVRDWKIFSGKTAGEHGVTAESLQQFSDTLDQIRFTGQPQLNMTVDGDAHDVHSFIVRLNADVPAARTPWFSARHLQLAASLTAPADAPAEADPAWGFWTNALPFRLAWIARTTELHADSLRTGAAECAGVWRAPELAVTRLAAQLGGGKLAAAATLDITTRTVTFTNESSFDLHAVAALLTEKTRDRLAEISWIQPPQIHATGALQLPAWTNGAADWRADIEPSVRLRGELAFTNALADGVAPLDSVRTHFTYTNLIWSLPDLEIINGRTRLSLNIEECEMTKNFRCRIAGEFDAASVKPFLMTSNAVRGYGHLNFTEPLELNLDVTGSLREFEQLAATGHIALNHFAIRQQTVDRLTADLSYSNLTVEFLHPQLSRAGGTQTFAAEKLTLDIAGQRLFFIGGEGNVEPAVVSRAIGPKTAKAMEPYEFLAIPQARVNGCVPLQHRADGELVTDEADLRFDVLGTTPFRWRKFETPAITGTIHWWKNFIILTNTEAECYGGPARGWGVFDVSPDRVGTAFSFFVTGTNVDFHRMGVALWAPTNQLAGSLSGDVTVTSANSEGWQTWNGFGALKLRDGLLWDVPVFGLISPVLNVVVPGLGNNRATQAAGRFTMTNGVIYTDTLDIHTLMMRLKYDGTVDLQQNVKARVTAQFLRNTPLLGDVLRLVLWIPVSKAFECEVTGTLGQPKVKPIHTIPGLLLVPLHPIRSVEDMFKQPDGMGAE